MAISCHLRHAESLLDHGGLPNHCVAYGAVSGVVVVGMMINVFGVVL